jgi:hypothetical protein
VTHAGAKRGRKGFVAAQPTETGVAPAPPLTPKQGSIRHGKGRMARVEGLRRPSLVNASIETEVNGPFLLRSRHGARSTSL